MDKDLKRTQIYVSEAKLKKLKYKALDRDMNVSELIRKLIDDFLKKEEKTEK